MNTCFPCVLRVSAPAEKYAMLFVSADFISVTRHCRSCCLLFLLLPPPSPSHTRTHIRALLVVRVFPFAGHLLSSFAFALRRIASFCLRDNKYHKSFFLPNGTPRPAPLPLPLYHYWLPLPLCIFVSVSLSRHFVLLLWSHFVGGGSWQRLFRLCLYLCFALAIVCYCLRFVGHSAAPRCAAQGSDICISTLSHSLCLPLAARPLGPSAQAAAGSVSFLRFARFTELPAALTDCIWQRLKIVVETSLLRRPFPAAAGLFIFVISSLRRSLNG